MPASMNPRITLLELPISCQGMHVKSCVNRHPLQALQQMSLPSPITRIPHYRIYQVQVLIFSNASGNLSHTFLKVTIIYPAAKPATRAPKNPDFPLAAIISTNKTKCKCRSVTNCHCDKSCQYRKHKAKCCSTDTVLNSAATGVIVPKLLSFCLLTVHSYQH